MKNLIKKEESKSLLKMAKRVMFVGIMVIGLAMPVQSSAQNANRGEGKGRVAMVQKKNDKKGADKKKVDKKKKNKKNNNYYGKNNKGNNKHHKAHKPKVVVKHHYHYNRPAVVHHPVVVHEHCNGAAEAVGAVIGLAALVALLAN